MKKKYMISRVVLCTLTFLISFIVFMNEDVGTRNFATIIFTGVSLLASFTATPLSKRIIAYGSGISQKSRRIFFYVVLFPTAVIIIDALWTLVYFLMEKHIVSDPQNFVLVLGWGILEGFILIFAVFFILFPYIQTLIVLFLGKLMKD